MTDTPNLGLPYIAASQAQKHVTHNDALRVLDAVVQLAVLDATRTAPPSSPAEGQRHLVAASPTGAWAGKATGVAIWQDGAWAFLMPKTGWRVWSVADNALMVFDGALWRTFSTSASSSDTLARLGINTAASSTNLLNVKSNAALFAAIATADSGSGDVRVQLSKESAAKTASLVFSDAYSGRAEFGLTGDDDFHIKVSADGAAWFEAIRVARATGKVSFPASGGPRETLTANRIYYVRPDGSDANGGLANTPAGAFLTVQKAIDVAAALDLGIYGATIQLAAGNYGATVIPRTYVGAGPITILGDTAAPANVTIGTIDGSAGYIGKYVVRGVKTSSSGLAFNIQRNALLDYGNIEFGAAGGGFDILAALGARVAMIANCSISAGKAYHAAAFHGASILEQGLTMTLIGTPAFSSAFASAANGGQYIANGMTFSGTATGYRWTAITNGIVDTGGGGAGYLPGNAAGVLNTGGQYV